MIPHVEHAASLSEKAKRRFTCAEGRRVNGEVNMSKEEVASRGSRR